MCRYKKEEARRLNELKVKLRSEAHLHRISGNDRSVPEKLVDDLVRAKKVDFIMSFITQVKGAFSLVGGPYVWGGSKLQFWPDGMFPY